MSILTRKKGKSIRKRLDEYYEEDYIDYLAGGKPWHIDDWHSYMIRRTQVMNRPGLSAELAKHISNKHKKEQERIDRLLK